MANEMATTTMSALSPRTCRPSGPKRKPTGEGRLSGGELVGEDGELVSGGREARLGRPAGAVLVILR
jgi:hypothetical protein